MPSRLKWAQPALGVQALETGSGVVCGGVAATAGTAELLTTSLSSLLGLKYGIFFAGTSTRAPVFGLRPMRGCLWRVRKLPNPRISILSPARRDRTILMTWDSFRVTWNVPPTAKTGTPQTPASRYNQEVPCAELRRT